VQFNPRARALRRRQTDEEKQLWRALRGGRFTGFKWRRQHPVGEYTLDFYCHHALLAVELDGFHHGLPEQACHDEERSKFLASAGIEVLRFWNHQWRDNRSGCLLDIWNAVQRRSGCLRIMKNPTQQRFIPPRSDQIKTSPKKPLRPLT
jgi:very-short-patch-repair endonuclease